MTDEIKELMIAASNLNAAIAKVMQQDTEVELDVGTVQYGDRLCPLVLVGTVPCYSTKAEAR